MGANQGPICGFSPKKRRKGMDFYPLQIKFSGFIPNPVPILKPNADA